MARMCGGGDIAQSAGQNGIIITSRAMLCQFVAIDAGLMPKGIFILPSQRNGRTPYLPAIEQCRVVFLDKGGRRVDRKS
jgi:hypothetical protein